jgi:alcohol dehydrogenase (cytochrome c)
MTTKTLARLLKTTTAITLVGGTMLALAMPARAAEVSQTRLENADSEPQNWLLGFQNYSSHRFSRLNQINTNNVGNLKVAFTIPVTTALLGRKDINLENHVLVDDGFMYFDDGGGVIYKVDVRSGTKGAMVWRADAAVAKDEAATTRGVAMWGNAVYANLPDGRVIAVDRTSGEITFDKQIARQKHPGAANLNIEKETFHSAPLPAEGKILVGNSAGDSGTNGWLAAIDAKSGQQVWRTYTIPGPGEPGHDTWKDNHGAWMTGAAALWTTGSYDVQQKVTIWGTGQPGPMHDPEFRPGDNLYSNSAVAFDINDGKIKWYFQYVPNESWDYDEQGVHLLLDAPMNGTSRSQVVHFGRNGFFYQLDRTNGSFIGATQYVDKVNWTKGIDPKTGKPVEYDPKLDIQKYQADYRMLRGMAQGPAICPHRLGGTRWQPPAYNPDTKIAYVGSRDGCASFKNLPVIALSTGGIDPKGPGAFHGIDRPNIKDFDMHGLLAAVDVTTGKTVARLRTQYDNQSGVLATAGGLIFTATVGGSIQAHNDKTLAELWRFESGIGIKAPPITYGVGGKQYVAILVGASILGGAEHPELAVQLIPAGMLYVFSL